MVVQWLFSVIGAGWPAPRWYFWCDAWIFVGSIVATYAMARGWIDFWLAWIAVDLVGVPLLVHSGFYPSAVLYAVYARAGPLRLLRLAAGLPRAEPRAASRARWRHDRPGSDGHRRARVAAARAAGRCSSTDDEDRENEGDVILAAATPTPSGWRGRSGTPRACVCAPMPGAVADRLALPPMVADNEDPRGTAYTVSVDARAGISTGISAADRAHTLRLLADPATDAADLARPGHVFPLRARDGGVLQRAGHTEAAVDLCRLAGLAPVGVIAELVHDDGSMMRLPAVLRPRRRARPAGHHHRPADRRGDSGTTAVEREARTRLPTAHGVFDLLGYRDLVTGAEHVALVSPLGHDRRPAPLVRAALRVPHR